MSMKRKLMLLELVTGVFGWGWLIAGAFAIYYLVMAIGFEASWVPFIVALVVSGIAKWLARGFKDSKQRVAFEADLVAKGLSPEEAGQAWVEAYAGQDPSSAPSNPPTDPLTMEENRKRHRSDPASSLTTELSWNAIRREAVTKFGM